MNSPTRIGGAAALLALLAFALPVQSGARLSQSPQSPAGRTLFGIAEPNSWRQLLGPNSDQVASKIASLHAESQRWPISWADAERAPPLLGSRSYSFGVYDQMYSADLARGIRPLIVVGSAPSWASPVGAPLLQDWIPPDPSHLEDFAAFCAELARRYPDAIGIEIWNEPNYPRFWGGRQPSASAYSDLLASAYGAIKSVNPGMNVISAGLLPALGPTTGGVVPSAKFADEMFADGAANHMDGFGVHLYPAQTGPGNHRLFSPWLNLARSVGVARAAHVPIWVTEVGITTTGPYGVSPDQQAAALSDFFVWVQQQPDVDAFYIHTLTEPTQDESNPEKGYALLAGPSYPYAPKPAFVALQQDAEQTPIGGPASENIVVKLKRRWIRASHRTGRVSVSFECSSWCMAAARGRVVLGRPRGHLVRYRLRSVEIPFDELSRGKLVFGLTPGRRHAIKRALAAGRRVRVRASVSGRNMVVESLRRGVAVAIR